MRSTCSTEEADPPGWGRATGCVAGGAHEHLAWREARRVSKAALGPVRALAGRHGGPRTCCAVGWSHRV